MKNCCGIGGLLFGHSYVARYSTGPVVGKVHLAFCTASELANLAESTKSRTYVHDICLRCGDIKKEK
jgi:hypothetical protein